MNQNHVIPIKPKGSNNSIVFFFLLILAFGAALKDDLGAISDDPFWSELSIHPLIALFKSYSYTLLAGAGVLSIYVAFTSKKLALRISGTALAILALSGFASLRASLIDQAAAVKLLQALVLYSLVILTSGLLMVRHSIETFKQEAARALFWFATIYIAINVLNMVSGYGFVPGNSRFFGTTAHPNFIGIQLAVCNIAIAANVLLKPLRQWKTLATASPTLVVGVVAQLATGSRTALVALVVGLAILLLVKRKFRIDPILIIFTILIFGFFSYLALSPDTADGAFQRGTDGFSNTRAEAWSSMISLIIENPWFGNGYFIGFSENSYLRSMVAFGIPYGTALTIILCWIFSLHFRNSKRTATDLNSPNHVYFALIGGLLAGGIFEGYLVDSWSLSKFILIFLSSTAILTPKKSPNSVT